MASGLLVSFRVAAAMTSRPMPRFRTCKKLPFAVSQHTAIGLPIRWVQRTLMLRCTSELRLILESVTASRSFAVRAYLSLSSQQPCWRHELRGKQRAYDLTIEDIRAALKFAGELVDQEEHHPLPT